MDKKFQDGGFRLANMSQLLGKIKDKENKMTRQVIFVRGERWNRITFFRDVFVDIHRLGTARTMSFLTVKEAQASKPSDWQ